MYKRRLKKEFVIAANIGKFVRNLFKKEKEEYLECWWRTES